jgi:hypothetical protein
MTRRIVPVDHWSMVLVSHRTVLRGTTTLSLGVSAILRGRLGLLRDKYNYRNISAPIVL